MKQELFESKWKQIRSQTTGWWSLMGDHDLIKVDKAKVKLDKYINLLQVKYGYTRDHAKKEIDQRVAEYEARQRIVAHLPGPAG